MDKSQLHIYLAYSWLKAISILCTFSCCLSSIKDGQPLSLLHLFSVHGVYTNTQLNVAVSDNGGLDQWTGLVDWTIELTLLSRKSTKHNIFDSLVIHSL